MSSISRLEEIFEATLELSSEARPGYLDHACAHDPTLRQQVERLLSKHASDTTGVLSWSPGTNGHATPPEPEPNQIGQYKIIGVLGEGGMGRVYEAQQQSPRRSIALKVIRTGFGPGTASRESQRRFRREAETLAQLQHIGIAQVYESGEATDDRGTPRRFIAMELIRGKPLFDHAQSAKLSINHRIELLARTCDAVQHAHQRGIIHRDLKSANILVVPGISPVEAGRPAPSDALAAGPSTQVSTRLNTGQSTADHIGQPKVLDFGIARLRDDDTVAQTQVTEAGRIIGTLAYMSPEQLRADSRQIDTRTDVYVLGVLGYELLCGAPPLDIATKPLPEAARIITDVEPPRLGQRCRECRGELETIIAKAMQKDRDRRYNGAGELAADLRRYLRHEPILARPPTTMYQLRKLAQRNRALVVGSSVAVAALIIGLAATLVALGNARRERAIAQEASTRHGQVAKVLKDIFAGINPESSKGRDISVLRETLERIEARLSTELAGQPGTESELRTVLGDAYRNLSKPERAEQLYRLAITLAEKASGPSAPELPALYNRLALLLTDQSRFAEAQTAASTAQALLRSSAPGEAGDDEVVTNILRQADLARATGKFPDGEALYRQALARAASARGEQSAPYASVLASLANIVDDLGRYAEAEQLLTRALAISTATAGELHPDTVDMLDNLSGLYYRQNKLPEAEAAARKTLDINKRLVPGDSAATAVSMTRVANALAGQNNFVEATELQQASLEMNQRIWGPSNKLVASGYANLGQLLVDNNQLEQGLEMGRRALELDRTLFTAPSSQVLADLMMLTHALQRAGRFSDTAPYAREMLTLAPALLPENHPQRQSAEVNGAYMLAEAAWASRETPETSLALEKQSRDTLTEAMPRILRTAGDHAPITIRAKLYIIALDVFTAAAMHSSGEPASRVLPVLESAAPRFESLRQLIFSDGLQLPEPYKRSFRQAACTQLARLHQTWELVAPATGHAALAADWATKADRYAAGTPD